MKLKILLLFSITLFLLTVPNLAYGSEFYAETDKPQYFVEETIIVSGEVDEFIEDSILTFVVVNPNSNISTIIQEEINEDKTFNVEFYIIEGSEFGTYEIRLQYNADKIKITFEIISNLLNIQTDQPQYSYGDIVFVNGTIYEFGNGTNVTISIINPTGDITYADIIQVNVDHTFDMNFDIEGNLYNEIGTYTIEATYEGHNINTSFETLSSNIIMTTDESVYYLNDIISINGTIFDVDWNTDTTVTHSVYDIEKNLVFLNNTTLNPDETFNFIINTEILTYSDTYSIDVTFQNYTATEYFTFYDYPNMTNESLYTMIINNESILADFYYTMMDYNNTLTIQNNMLLIQQESINILSAMVEELTNQIPPLPLDAPIITSVIADDPDNLDDIFSDGDTITILFDSETNVPLGDGTLTKQEVNNLFTFSEKISQAYSGTWTNSSAFTITVNSMANSDLIINSTTVTPAQITPILPADNNPAKYSHQTSPPLSGDFGEL